MRGRSGSFAGRFGAACVLAALASVGCEERGGAGSPARGTAAAAAAHAPPRSDAEVAADFERHARRFVAAAGDALADGWVEPLSEEGGRTWRQTFLLQGKGRVDVRRTDSLVSPFVGTVGLTGSVATVLGDGKYLAGYAQPVTVTFAHQKGAWVLTAAEADNVLMDGDLHRRCDLLAGGGTGHDYTRDGLRAAAARATAERP